MTITEDLVHSVHQHISNLLENSFGLLMRFNKEEITPGVVKLQENHLRILN